MAYNLVQLHFFTGEQRYEELAQRQLMFMSAEAGSYPAAHAMFLLALSDFVAPPEKVCRGENCQLPFSF